MDKLDKPAGEHGLGMHAGRNWLNEESMSCKGNLEDISNSDIPRFEFAPLQLVQIYFDTATYDEIERDRKITLTGQLGLIGGTMGLLTGFSILSGVEIIYFAVKFFMSLRIQTADLAAKKVGTHLF